MKKFMTGLKPAKKNPKYDSLRPGNQTATAVITHEEIAKRAYEIYLNNGRRGSAEANWYQAEQELRNKKG